MNDTYMGLDNIDHVYEKIQEVFLQLESGISLSVPVLDEMAWVPVINQLNNMNFENVLYGYVGIYFNETMVQNFNVHF